MTKVLILPLSALLSMLISSGIQAEERARSAEADGRQKAEEARQEAVPTTGQTWREPVTGMEFVWVPAGEFDMGSASSGASDEKPVHQVYVDGFWMGKFKVTQGQWQTVMGSNPSNDRKGDDYPVEMVSWEDAQEFIRRLNGKSSLVYRLPTEAEWEYACRAGTTEDRYGDLNDIAWHYRNSGQSTQPVGRKNPNSYGLYDMLGNVCEWCQDWHGSYASGYVRNPAGPSTGSHRIYRGASWAYLSSDIRASNRNGGQPSDKSADLGFRLARSK